MLYTHPAAGAITRGQHSQRRCIGSPAQPSFRRPPAHRAAHEAQTLITPCAASRQIAIATNASPRIPPETREFIRP